MSEPTVFYHYTTREGLLGICDSKTIWATSIRHLNDAAEFTYAYGVLRQALTEAIQDQPPDVVATAKLLERSLDTTRHDSICGFIGTEYQTYVVSFSEHGDQLSQWRAYGSGGGYSLGFRRVALEAIAQKAGFELVRCSYDATHHRAEANRLAKEIVSRVIETIPQGARKAVPPAADRVPPAVVPEYFKVHSFMLDELQKVAPGWKHRAFHEEAEWRLVSKPPQHNAKFRVGRSVLVPYVSVELVDPDSEINNSLAILEQVWVGPSSEQELAAATAMQLLAARAIACPALTLSGTPLRHNWSS